jgi:drug/metabolite transporter (DMT)-like permease
LLLALAGIVVLSPESLLIRLVAADRWTIVFWRGLLLAVGLLGVSLIGSFAGTFRMGKAGLLVAMLFGAQAVLFVTSITTTTVANTLVALSAAPLFAAIYERILFRNRLSPRMWAIIAMAMVGILVMFGGAIGGGSLSGNLAGLGAAAGYGGVFVIIRHNRTVNMVPAMGLGGLVAALEVGLWADPLSVTWTDMGYLALSGLLVLPVAFGLLAIAPRFAPAPEVGLVTLLETVLGPFWVWLALGEEPGGRAMLGGLIVLAAVAASLGPLSPNPDLTPQEG